MDSSRIGIMCSRIFLQQGKWYKKARFVLCRGGALIELGYEQTTIASRLSMSVPAMGYGVRRGEQVFWNNDYRLEKGIAAQKGQV